MTVVVVETVQVPEAPNVKSLLMPAFVRDSSNLLVVSTDSVNEKVDVELLW